MLRQPAHIEDLEWQSILAKSGATPHYLSSAQGLAF